MQGVGEGAGGGEVGGGGAGGGAAAGREVSGLGWVGNGNWREGRRGAYKTQTVGGLEGLLGTGVPLLESWRT